MNPIILVGAGILVLGLGLGMGYWLAHSQRNREASKVSDIQQELDDYRRSVTEHFGATAQHFQTIGQQYQSLYKHMVQGADSLCDPAQSDTLLGFSADVAPAIETSATDAPDSAPKVIRDYAPEEEIEPPQAEVEADTEAVNAAEAPEDSPALDEIAVEPGTEDVVTEQSATPTVTEEDRTVH